MIACIKIVTLPLMLKTQGSMENATNTQGTGVSNKTKAFHT